MVFDAGISFRILPYSARVSPFMLTARMPQTPERKGSSAIFRSMNFCAGEKRDESALRANESPISAPRIPASMPKNIDIDNIIVKINFISATNIRKVTESSAPILIIFAYICSSRNL